MKFVGRLREGGCRKRVGRIKAWSAGSAAMRLDPAYGSACSDIGRDDHIQIG